MFCPAKITLLCHPVSILIPRAYNAALRPTGWRPSGASTLLDLRSRAQQRNTTALLLLLTFCARVVPPVKNVRRR